MDNTGNPNKYLPLMMALFGALATILFVATGASLVQRDYTDAAVQFVIGVFSILLSGITALQAIQAERNKVRAIKRDLEYKLTETIKEITDDVMKEVASIKADLASITDSDCDNLAHRHEIQQAFNAVIGEVCPDRIPTAEDVPEIEKRFHEVEPNLYLKMTAVGDQGFSVDIQPHPFDVPTTTDTTTEKVIDTVKKPAKKKSAKKKG